MNNSKDSLGDRQKGYENIWKTKLPRRMPMIIRVDGKAFHTYTKGCQRPFDIEFSCRYVIRRISVSAMEKYLPDKIDLIRVIGRPLSKLSI